MFVSHSSEDSGFLAELVPFLQAKGADAWYSPDRIKTADEWERKILEGLRACEWFLVVLSPRAIESEWVRAEVHWATENRKGRIIPVLLETCKPEDLHLRLNVIQYADFTTNRESGKAQLVTILWGQEWPVCGRLDLSDFLKGFSRLDERWFSVDAANAIRTAIEYATNQGRGELTTQHLLLGLLVSESGITGKTVRFFRREPASLREKLLRRIQAGGIVPAGTAKPSETVKRLFAKLWHSVAQEQGLLIDEIALLESIVSDEESRTALSLLKFLDADRQSVFNIIAEFKHFGSVQTDMSSEQSP
ncbi:MAG: TIR domain-containing protein [Pirellulaceae bacterium]